LAIFKNKNQSGRIILICSFVCYVTIRIQIGFDGKDKQLSENIKEKRGENQKGSPEGEPFS
jgi:hypothetical protein